MKRAYKLLGAALLLSSLFYEVIPLSQTMLQNTAIASPNPRHVRKDFLIASDPNIQLFMREVRPANVRNTGGPILLLHGGGGGGLAAFDVPGYSLAEEFAKAGHAVYTMNIRGWERSTRPAGLDAPPNANPPLVTSEEAVRDISAVVNWIRDRNQNQPVALVGWATGGHWAGMYTSRNIQQGQSLGDAE